jgi:hypothetical protein
LPRTSLKRSVQHRFEQLGQLARQHHRPVVTERCSHVVQRLVDAMGRLVEDQRARLGRQSRQAFAARRGLGRKEAFEDEAVAGQARHAQRGDRSAGARHRRDADAGGTRGADHAETRIADQRRTRIGHQRQRFAAQQARDQLRGLGVLVVLVQRQQRPFQTEMREQLAGVWRVSSAQTAATLRSVSSARGDRSPRLPIGVATTWSVPGGRAGRRGSSLIASCVRVGAG